LDNKVRRYADRRCDSDNGSYWLTGWFDSNQLLMYSGGTPVTQVNVFITSRHLRDSIWGLIDHKTTSYTTSGYFIEEISDPTIENYGFGVPLPSIRGGFNFSFPSGWGGHTAYAQHYFYYQTAKYHYTTAIYNLTTLNITFNFLGQTCTVTL
jgi:hypothetical protein